MDVAVLVVPDCPNHTNALARVNAALAAVGVPAATVRTVVVTDLALAEAVAMHGSPTFLIDGEDPFAVEGSKASMSCRLYRTLNGFDGCPTVNELADAISAHAARPSATGPGTSSGEA